MKTKFYGYGQEYKTREEAEHAADVKELDTTGLIWNGEMYHDNETGADYWPIDELEVDEDGEIIQQIDRLGYYKI